MSSDSPITWHWTQSPLSRRLRLGARLGLKPVMNYWPMTDRGVALVGKVNEWVGARLPRPKRIEIEDVELGGVRCELTTPSTPATDDLAGGAILYLHGGAFLFCGPSTHRAICGMLASTAGVPVYSVDYRQLPAGAVAASVADAMSAYTALLDRVADRTRIVVAGDSAGGYLAMKVAELSALRNIARPVAAVGFSPVLNFDFAREDPGYFRRDAYLPMRPLEKLRERWLSGPDAIEGNPSPMDVDPDVYPPVFMSAAEYEMLRPGVETMTRRLHEAGVTVETHLWVGQVHAFPAVGPVLPEAREIIRLSVDFARRAARAARVQESSCA